MKKPNKRQDSEFHLKFSGKNQHTFGSVMFVGLLSQSCGIFQVRQTVSLSFSITICFSTTE